MTIHDEILEALVDRMKMSDEIVLGILRRLTALEALVIAKGLVSRGEIEASVKNFEATIAVDAVFDPRIRALQRFTELIEKKAQGEQLSAAERAEAEELLRLIRGGME